MIKQARFSNDGKYRYFLLREWDEEKPLAMCIGLNPSTANEEKDDPTISHLIKMLGNYGYGGFYMVNLFALVSSNPEDLRSCPDPLGLNDTYLAGIYTEVQDVIFCWGSFKQADYRVKHMIKKFPGALCFGKTAKGKPIHPLAAAVWMKSKCELQKFNP